MHVNVKAAGETGSSKAGGGGTHPRATFNHFWFAMLHPQLVSVGMHPCFGMLRRDNGLEPTEVRHGKTKLFSPPMLPATPAPTSASSSPARGSTVQGTHRWAPPGHGSAKTCIRQGQGALGSY